MKFLRYSVKKLEKSKSIVLFTFWVPPFLSYLCIAFDSTATACGGKQFSLSVLRVSNNALRILRRFHFVFDIGKLFYGD